LDVGGNTVLITGGATGIGFALAEKFVNAGSQVIVCGRRKSKLQIAKHELPALRIRQCDVSMESQRRSLLHWIAARFPDFNMLINNAGIQRQIDFTSPTVAKLPAIRDDEVTTNLAAPIRLCALFTPRLLKKEMAAIVNVSSGLAFVPIAMMPVYCATKAAIHSFTISLRHQLRGTSVRVFEAAPPTTDTELDQNFAGEKEQAYRGISAQEVAAAITDAMQRDREEILVGEAAGLYQAAMRSPEVMFRQLND